MGSLRGTIPETDCLSHQLSPGLAYWELLQPSSAVSERSSEGGAVRHEGGSSKAVSEAVSEAVLSSAPVRGEY